MYQSTPMTTKHFIFYIIGLCTASLLIYPSLYTQSAENNVIIAIASSLVAISIFLFISKAYLSCKSSSFKEIVYSTLGRFIGSIYLVIFASMVYISIIGTCTVFGSSLSTSVFIKTPIWFILLLFIGASLYIKMFTSKSSNIFTIITSTIMIICIIFLFVILQKYRKLYNIDESNLSTVFSSNSMRSFFLQLGGLSSFGMLLPLFKNIRRGHNDMKNIFIGLSITVGVFLFSIIGGISIFGVKRFSNIYYPLFIESQLINYQGILENGDALTLLIISFGYILKYVIEICILNEILLPNKIKDNLGYTLLSSVIIFLSSSFLSNKIDTLFIFLTYYQYASLVVFMILPLTIFSINFLSRN